ncbi:MAG: polysaccharide pyruvyl transferase family protein [Bacteroidales bacterium]|nr:polysaccharide pyruvyl transferase family protein [Bacteroidales bacterium]
MAKVNLLTIHYGKCYGAVMQTYATCKMLENAGHTVNVINIINPKQKGNWKKFQYWKDCVRELQFWVFKKKYFSKLTNKSYSIKDISLPESDITVVGSDQVWNRDITGCFGFSFFLDFVDDQPKLALSSSLGKEKWTEDKDYSDQVKKLLSQFKAISVRESSGVQLLNDIFGINAIQLPDPTIGYGCFENLLLNNKTLHHVYPFLLINDAMAIEKAKHIANSIGLPLFKHTTFSCRLQNGPRHWLTRIKNSDYIITDSFHGLALSIIFNKQFFVFCASETKFTRLRSLLKLLSLEERYIESIEDFEKRKDILLNPIDYVQVNHILQSEQSRYKSFIQQYL